MQKNIKKSVKTKGRLLNKTFSTDYSGKISSVQILQKLLYWAAIIESSDDAIISISVEGIITSWNKGAERIYGYTASEVIGKPVSILMPQEKEDDFPYIIRQLRNGKRIEHYETKRKTKDGRLICVSITVSPIRDEKGNIIGASKIARDITERVENEKRRDEFVTAASHELKTPLTSQKAFGELLEKLIEKNGHIQYRPYIQKINRQTLKLSKLVEDLLEFSRIQTGRIRMENKKFRFDSLVGEIIENMQMTTSHKIVREGKTHKFVKGDKERIGQVLTNLISNAIKYSPNGNKVHVNSELSGTVIKVAVKDYGIGIPNQYHTKIFERFFRVNGNDEETFPGMGIGLHISRKIIEYYGGKVWVDSEKGKGSTFYFTLPFLT